MLDLGLNEGPVKVDEAEGLDLAVAEILELDVELVLEFAEQVPLEDEDLLLGGLGGGIGPGPPGGPASGRAWSGRA
jgi:hypothetical protein